MKKLETISELTEGMNEFEKFMFFRRRAEDRDKLRDANMLLQQYGNISFDDIRKRMRVSEKRWYSYMYGSMPLPWGFLYDFSLKFSNEIREARTKRDQEKLKEYFSYVSSGMKDMDQSASEAISSSSSVTV